MDAITALVIEDTKPHRIAIAGVLKHAGINTVLCKSVEAAGEKLDGNIDVIVLDLTSSESNRTGTDVVQMACLLQPSPFPIVVCTADETFETCLKVIQYPPVRAYVPKSMLAALPYQVMAAAQHSPRRIDLSRARLRANLLKGPQ